MRNRALGAVAAVVALSGLTQPAATARAAEPTRVLIVGDSITHGSVGDWTWRYRLWKNLRASGEQVDFVGPHHGVFESETESMEDDRYADPEFDTDHAARWGMGFATQERPVGDLVSEYMPDVVVEMLGVNDLAFYDGTPEQVVGDAELFVSRVRAVNPHASVVLGQLATGWVRGAGEFNALLADLAERLDTPDARVVVAEAPASYVEDVDTYDPLHPNAQGEVKIAQAVAEALARVGVGSNPDAFPQVVNGPVTAPVLTTQPLGRWTRLSWTMPLGATGVQAWVRDLSAGTPWREVSTQRMTAPRPGHELQWRVQAFKGTAVSPRFSNVVTIAVGPR